MENTLAEEIKKLDADAAVKRLDAYLAEHTDDTDALTMRGIRHWSMQHRSEAINDWLAAIKLDPECKAKQALKAAYDILDFYNKDLYNP